MNTNDERGHFDDAFEVSDDDVEQATKPPKPWERGPADAVVKEFRKSPEAGPSGYHYFASVAEVTRGDKRVTIRDNGLSLSPAAKGKFIQYCGCFGLRSTADINAVRRGELSPVGLTGRVVVGPRTGDDGNEYNEIKRYVVPKE